MTLVGCNASDYFSQDLEDLAEDGVINADYRVMSEETEPTRQAPKQQERKPEAVDFNKLWGPFWRALGEHDITTASMETILGTKNPSAYAKNHEPRHVAILQELVEYGVSMELGPSKLCEMLGVDSLAAWVDDDPDGAVEIAKETIDKAMAGEPAQEEML